MSLCGDLAVRSNDWFAGADVALWLLMLFHRCACVLTRGSLYLGLWSFLWPGLNLLHLYSQNCVSCSRQLSSAVSKRHVSAGRVDVSCNAALLRT
jgi:hypothetical protein